MKREAPPEFQDDEEGQGSSLSVDLPVRMFLQRQRTRQCSYCKRYMDCKILAVHMQNCLSKNAGEDTDSLAKNPPRSDHPKGRAQQCTFCKHWMDSRVLVFHMWEYHLNEVEANHEKEAGEDTDSSAKEPRRSDHPKRGLKQCTICKHWMDNRVLVFHMWEYHRNEVEANAASESPTKRSRYGTKTVDSDFETNCSTNHHVVEVEKGSYWVRCPICELQQLSQEELVDHCFRIHGDKFSVVHQRLFCSARECELWKESIRKSHCTAWIETDQYRTDTQIVVLYRCSRVFGNEDHCDDPEEVEPNVIHSCTSFLKERISDDGSVLVKFCTRHVAHDLEPAELPLSKSDEEFIEGFIRQGLSMVAIRRKARCHFGPTNRLHWITDDDIRNISARLEEKLEYLNDASPGTSCTAENSHPSHDVDHTQPSVNAAALLEEGVVKEELESMNNYDESSHRSNESPIEGESLHRCSNCMKLNERMSELEAVVKRLNERLTELEGSKNVCQ